MKVYTLGDAIPFSAASAITVGTYDGVHAGHRHIIETMKATAREHSERTVVITFEPHPQIVLAKPERQPVRLLTSLEQKLELLGECGVDVAVVIPFTTDFAATAPGDFVRNTVATTIGVRHFFVGHDHMFGKDRGGNEQLLASLGVELGFAVVRIDSFMVSDTVVSSTRIRRALAEGAVELAETLLQRAYQVRGTVIRGDQRGSKLGIPTANIQPLSEHSLLPGHGVYVVSSVIGGKRVYGMANVGLRPTFTNDTVSTLEVHYLDFDAMLYDTVVNVDFHRFIRAEHKFESADMFLSQLRDDRLVALEYAELQQP